MRQVGWCADSSTTRENTLLVPPGRPVPHSVTLDYTAPRLAVREAVMFRGCSRRRPGTAPVSG